MPLRAVRHKSPVAILLVDAINHFEFPGGKELLKHAVLIRDNITSLKRRARKAGVPIVYVNDNFAQWRSDAKELVNYCTRPAALGREFVSPIAPDREDYFVLKPMHSAFYQTPLDVLLRYFGAKSVILSGLSTNSCIVCSAQDARMRDLNIVVASDCCAAMTLKEHHQALEHIRSTAGGRIVKSGSIRFAHG